MNKYKKILIFLYAPAASILSHAQNQPLWWSHISTHQSIHSYREENNFAPACFGQAKVFAKNALEAIRDFCPEIADAIEADLVGPNKPIATWSSIPYQEIIIEDKTMLTIKELKEISTPFYFHLNEYVPQWLEAEKNHQEILSTDGIYPWTNNTSDDSDMSPALIGQLKYVFSLDFHSDRESNPDGIPDIWELHIINYNPSDSITQLSQINENNYLSTGALVGSKPTLRLHSLFQIDRRIEGSNPQISKPIYSTQNHASSVYVRNPSFWASDIQSKLTCISPWNSSSGVEGCGTAITSRHIIMADHLYISNGHTIRFIDTNNQVISKVVTNSKRVSQTDFRIGILDSDLPFSIIPCFVLPQNITNYLPNLETIRGRSGLPALIFDQHELGSVKELYSLSGAARYITSQNPTRIPYNINYAPGDSGNPAFMIINNELALISVHSWINGMGPATSNLIDEINTTISQLDVEAGISTGFTCSQIPLNDFYENL